jgi:hypothetical protein
LALYSSALDAHAHSDWLVDCAQIFQREAVDADRLFSLLEGLNLTVQASVAFSYLHDRLELPVADMKRLSDVARRVPVTDRAAVLLQAKPRGSWTFLTKYLRGLAKARRLLTRDRPLRDVIHTVLRARKLRRAPDAAAGLRHEVSLPGPLENGAYLFRATLVTRCNGVRRRHEFELNTATEHLARFRFRDLLGRDGWVEVQFSARVVLDEATRTVWLEARPGRTMRNDDPADLTRYSAVPFALREASFTAIKNSGDGWPA